MTTKYLVVVTKLFGMVNACLCADMKQKKNLSNSLTKTDACGREENEGKNLYKIREII